MPLVPVYSLKQFFDQPRVADIAGTVNSQILSSNLRARVRPGGTIAIGVGSRGIANVAVICKAAITTLNQMGFHPFVVAAMGSHGGATADGQRELLAGYGISEAAMGVPVRTEMDADQIGVNRWQEPVYWDCNALRADGVMVIARIKPHTDFTGRYESGIVKMLAIGLGKQKGAHTHHQFGVRGLRDMIPETTEVVLKKTPFALGLAIVENANDETALLEAIEPERLMEREPQLLDLARSWMARLPFSQIDLLVVGELGKNFSGTGMDVNVIGRQMVEGEPDRCDPRITRICLLDLSDESHGNAVGAGLADLITQRLLDKVDTAKTNVNYFTSCFLLRAKTPLALPTDLECIAWGLKTCWQPRMEEARIAIIPNTLQLSHLWISRPLADEARQHPNLKVGDTPRDLPFDGKGTLDLGQLFKRGARSSRHGGADPVLAS